ncbi:Histone-lysine N-methyltransferase, partial [Caligus rogercresseyi]
NHNAFKKAKHCRKESVKPQVTEYFPIRRSSRKSKKELDKQYTAELEDTLRNSSDDHLDLGIAYYSLKGRGIQAMRNFSKGEFVVEYAGDLVEIDIAKEREFQYSKDHSTGCYMYYFKHNEKQYW